MTIIILPFSSRSKHDIEQQWLAKRQHDGFNTSEAYQSTLYTSSSYRTENTVCNHQQDQSVNVICGNCDCRLWEPDGTYQYTVSTKCGFFSVELSGTDSSHWALKQQANIFKSKQVLKVLYEVKCKNEAPYVDTTFIHKVVYKLVTLHLQLNRSWIFMKLDITILYKTLLDKREFRKNWLHYLRA